MIIVSQAIKTALNRFFFHYFEEAKKEISGKIADYGRR